MGGTIHNMTAAKDQRDWLSRFSEATLHIASKLDSDGVLQGVTYSVSLLTGASYEAPKIFADSRDIGGIVTCGITPEERRRLGDLPRGLGIPGCVNEIEGPMKLTDIASYSKSAVLFKNHPPLTTFLVCTVRYQGGRLGNIYPSEKGAGRKFIPEEGDILLMVATPAALAIANTCRHEEGR